MNVTYLEYVEYYMCKAKGTLTQEETSLQAERIL